MKHGGKQALAWMMAFGATSAIFGSGSIWLKKVTSLNAHAAPHGDTGHDSLHGASDTSAAHAVDTTHAVDTAHHAEASNKDSHHKVAESKKHDAHATKDHGPKHHAPSKTDPHAIKQKLASAHDKAETDHGPAHTSPQKDAHAAPHWSYVKNAAEGPSHWGSLNEQFAECEKGQEQSPVDLKGAVSSASAPAIAWHYNPTSVALENNGHTIVANMPDPQNYITIDGQKYTLAQFHFHNPSEHKIAGIAADMEMHFVHKNSAGGLAVIGVMMHEVSGKENTFLKPLWEGLPREEHSKSTSHPTLNLAKLLPVHRDYFHYQGSLTTPPCSQGVRWFVLKDPVTVSGSQVDLYSGIFSTSTNRPIQPLLGREILQSIGPASVGH